MGGHQRQKHKVNIDTKYVVIGNDNGIRISTLAVPKGEHVHGLRN